MGLATRLMKFRVQAFGAKKNFMIIGEGVRLWNDPVATAPGSILCDYTNSNVPQPSIKHSLCKAAVWHSF